MIITIDGPAGSGKSTTARAVAERLGFHHLESGGFYRALTFAALEAGIPTDRWPALSAEELDSLRIHARPSGTAYRLFMREEDITDSLRLERVDRHVSDMARVRAVREWLLGRLRQTAQQGDLVADGRDMGTIVFPNAELKIFLTASTETRARRRLGDRGVRYPSAEMLRGEEARLLRRDRIDSEREVAPLRRPVDANDIDTTGLEFDVQVERIAKLARAVERQSESNNRFDFT